MSEKNVVPAEQFLPDRLFIIPLTGKPIFPGIFTPIMIESEEDIAVVEKSIETNSMIGLCLIKDDDQENTTVEDIFTIGTVAKIVKKINLPDGGINIFISTVKRFKIRRFISEDSPFYAAVEYLDDVEKSPDTIKALIRVLLSGMKQLSENNPLFSEEMKLNMVNIDHPGKIADFMTSILNIDKLSQQEILETIDIQKRIELVITHLKKEQELLRIQKKITKQINEKIEKSQREYFLREELKAIKKELGMDTDARSSEYRKFKEAVDALNLDKEVLEPVEQELEKFAIMEPSSSEYIVTRNYLETIVTLPWGDVTPDDFEIEKARKILDNDHYGLEDVKNRILEFLAVRKLKKDSKGSIICLVGPPGVGKTSVGKSIASALNKKFFRFSVGGMRDEAEIKGHRRTYVGAMPGKIIQGLKIVKSNSPVFMIDEIDKLGTSYQGDPSSALLEVLDPEQNIAFRDHYLDLPFDISNILFIVTANTLDSIPRPLLDRMEIIRIAGYIEEEKIEIAKRYLIPRVCQRNGLNKKDLNIPRKSLEAITEGWAREAGVRNYEKALNRIARKVATKIVLKTDKPPFKIMPEDLEEYLDQPYFTNDDIKVADVPGTAVGLAWTSMGGDTLIIEAISNAAKVGVLKLTGQMGEVMQESASIAFSYVKKIAVKNGVKSDFFDKNIIHLHIPEGATPKDGPSAGITMATAILSLAKNKKINKNVAMTGELSLTGKVLPIGGLKEKTIAAKRNKIKTIIIPAQNAKDLKKIPEKVKKGLTFVPVSTFDEVIKVVF
ncbi:MAG: endopeptidase La [Spirochaetales bacterium]|nr:endopeptidase La [Spirochaetales bacterium]